jgi:hypothetical protein
MELNVSLRKIAAVEAMERITNDVYFVMRFAELAAKWEYDDFDRHTEENFRRYVGRMAKLVSIELNTRVHIIYGTHYPFGFAFEIYGVQIYINFEVRGGGFYTPYRLL